jgi:hypothetical protein
MRATTTNLHIYALIKTFGAYVNFFSVAVDYAPEACGNKPFWPSSNYLDMPIFLENKSGDHICYGVLA